LRITYAIQIDSSGDQAFFVDLRKRTFSGLQSVEGHQRDPVVVDERARDDEAVKDLVAVELK